VGLLLGAALAVAAFQTPAALADEAGAPAQQQPPAIANRRPNDAPRLDERSSKRLPAPPPEYLTHNAGWLRVRYHPSARDRLRPLLAAATRARDELAQVLGAPPLASLEVRIAAVPAELARLGPADPPSAAAAVAYSDLRLVLLSLTSPLTLKPPDLPAQFRHALAHIALDEAIGHRPIPRWLHEGLATHLAREDEGARFIKLTEATLGGQLLALSELEASLPDDAPQGSLAHAEAADFVGFLQRSGPHRIERLTTELAGGKSFDDALAQAVAMPIEELERAWRKDLALRHGFLPVGIAGVTLSLLALTFVFVRKQREPRVSRALTYLRAKRLVHATQPRPLTRTPNAPRMTLHALMSRSRSAAPSHAEGEVPKVEHDGRWHTLH
jgi:hypothetical protein